MNYNLPKCSRNSLEKLAVSDRFETSFILAFFIQTIFPSKSTKICFDRSRYLKMALILSNDRVGDSIFLKSLSLGKGFTFFIVSIK